MVEYGTGISHGPVGQVSGGGGGSPVVGHPASVDLGTSIGNAVSDATRTFGTLPFAEQVLVVIVALFVLYVVARRAF